MDMTRTALDTDDFFLTAAQVAERYQISESTLANNRNTGAGLPWLKVGGRVLYRATDLAAAELAGARGLTRTTIRRGLVRALGDDAELIDKALAAIMAEATGE